MPTFKRPDDALNKHNTFASSESGVVNPNTGCYVQLNDDGDIQIMAADNLGIVVHRATKSITIMADTIRFITPDHEGLGWNNQYFNIKANTYSQPALVPASTPSAANIYMGVNSFYNVNNNTPVSQDLAQIKTTPVSGPTGILNADTRISIKEGPKNGAFA